MKLHALKYAKKSQISWHFTWMYIFSRKWPVSGKIWCLWNCEIVLDP